MAVFKSFEVLGSKIEKCNHRVLADEALKFNARLLQDWPVDTSTSLRAWQLRKISDNEWHETNDVDYSPIVWHAQRPNVVKPDNIIWWHGAGGEQLLNHTINQIHRRTAA